MPNSNSQMKKEMKELIEKFKIAFEDTKKPTYKEAQTRSDYIDGFFENLGWDIENKKRLPESVREVILEDLVEAEESEENPDYGFQAGTEKKFFAEAKKPFVDILTNKKACFQARSYGWTDKHRLTLLTNFENLAIYDTTVMPKDSDNPDICKVKQYNFKEYYLKYDEIYELISRDAVFSGQYDTQADKIIKEQGGERKNPDEFFLEQMKEWRMIIAKNMICKDSSLTDSQINDLVQKFLNCIIFLRICEDRKFENKEQLKDIIQIGNDLKFEKLLKDSDDKYGSELFAYPDKLSDSLTIDPEVVSIIEQLYYPESPFTFKVLSSSILGQVYESFLGEQIHIDKNDDIALPKGDERLKHPSIMLVDAPELVGKDIVATPKYIVKKIIEESLKVCKGKHPDEIQKLRILDPACGSGLFSQEALQFLIDCVIDWDKKNGETRIYAVEGGHHLKFEEKRKLVDCLYAVDIDYNAVAATKFALCVKLLEDETLDTTANVNHILPSLKDQIKCGNSVVDDSFWSTTTQTPELEEKINTFDWENQFPNIIDESTNNSGFDIITGNPPYLTTEHMKKLIPEQKEFFAINYVVADGQYDKYFIFIENGLNLLKQGGTLGFIVPHKFTKIKAGNLLRQLIDEHKEKIIDFGALQVFPGKTTYACLLFLKKEVS